MQKRASSKSSMHVVFSKILPFKFFQQCCKGRVWRGTRNNSEELIIFSVEGTFGAEHCALQKEEHHANATQREAFSATGLLRCFSISYFSFLLRQTAGGLPILACYWVWAFSNWIVGPQHLHPFQPQCHKHLHSWWGVGWDGWGALRSGI